MNFPHWALFAALAMLANNNNYKTYKQSYRGADPLDFDLWLVDIRVSACQGPVMDYMLTLSLVLTVFTARRYASAVYAVVVCLCVCVSVTPRYCIKTAKLGITRIMPDDSPWTIVFLRQRSRRNSNGITVNVYRLLVATPSLQTTKRI